MIFVKSYVLAGVLAPWPWTRWLASTRFHDCWPAAPSNCQRRRRAAVTGVSSLPVLRSGAVTLAVACLAMAENSFCLETQFAKMEKIYN